MNNSSYDCFDLAQTTSLIARELNVSERRVAAAIDLLDSGNTIPFIARYRKEATQELDELALRRIEDLLAKHRDLAQRKGTVLKSIDQQGLLSPELRQQIIGCMDRQRLEDLYLPYKPKRRTRATIARERGLEPLAEILFAQERLPCPRGELLAQYVNPENDVPDEEAAIAGASDIVAERWSEDPALRSWLVAESRRGQLVSQVKRGKKEQEGASKFEMYFDHAERIDRVPSHRFLAMKRGEDEGILRIGVKVNDGAIIAQLKSRVLGSPRFEFRRELERTAEDCYARLLFPAAESALTEQLKEAADEEAISVFGKNLRELLLAPPAGPQVTIGIDPGFRTGCKVAVVDGTGKFLASATIYPTPPRNDSDGAAKKLLELAANYTARLIAIGNGTASRETDAFVTKVIRDHQLDITKVMVNESGASIYSASDVAVAEYPGLDVTVRGAISIAHRLQDPLAELVKIDPKSIGVGQYQHDVNQPQLRRCLEREVQSCVNSVGVDVNLASASLLAHVAGIGPKLAQNVVDYRNDHGPFAVRSHLIKVPKLGQKAFEQSAGFLRIRGGSQPLDNSAVHPETYYVVEKMAGQLGVPARQLVGNSAVAGKLTAADFVDDQTGLLTVRDILAELAKPGRDPRREFRVAKFAEGVHELEDLEPGMILEGTVTNVTKFGAFVDIGVHQDGLVHISQLADRYVEDPSDIVSVGDVVRVKVLEVQIERRRIALSRKIGGGE